MAPPTVSIIVPCYNEEQTIRLLLDALVDQSFPLDNMEILIADGMSTDRTRDEITAFHAAHPGLSLRVIDNEARIIPAALNRAIEAARGEFVVRLDAHSIPRPDYVARCVEALQAGRGDNVGGVWNIAPGARTWIARAIAAAAAHPLAVGDAHYRRPSAARYVDTVPFGAFRRSLVERIGPFDERLLTNEDYEFNVRIRKAGGTIWLDPTIRSTYFARPGMAALARQYWRYGFWKGRMLKRYPDTLRWRQLLPPLFVAGLAGGGLLSVFWDGLRPFYFAALLVYLAVLLGAGLAAAVRRASPELAIGLPLAIAAMHLCWGTALIWSLLRRS